MFVLADASAFFFQYLGFYNLDNKFMGTVWRATGITSTLTPTDVLFSKSKRLVN